MGTSPAPHSARTADAATLTPRSTRTARTAARTPRSTRTARTAALARRSAPTRRRARLAGAAALVAALALGCSPDGTRATATSPATTSPQDLCTRLITHWSGVLLDAAPGEDPVGRDYQAMGLSGGQYDILRAVVAAARTEEQARGRDAGRDLVAREARQRCDERYRNGIPTGGPWT
ncbi:hypothetical protein ACLF6K_31285 [Streptomyces xanthophaeus]|uniref:hypothetical protein n=1 Tax=Streptomyces xanthophaeus TaxID=67385 RepID=UPI00398F973A